MDNSVNPDKDTRAPLFCFEGIDGCGKSTLIKNLLAKFEENKTPCTSFAFPSKDGAVGSLIHLVFTGDMDVEPDAMCHLMVADAIDWDSKVNTLRQAGTTVLFDRHASVSGWVYQTERWSLEYVLNVLQCAQFHSPSLIFILDVAVETALARMKARGALNKLYEHDNAEYVSRLRSRYIAYGLTHPGTLLLDGDLPPAELADAAWSVMQAYSQRCKKE